MVSFIIPPPPLLPTPDQFPYWLSITSFRQKKYIPSAGAICLWFCFLEILLEFKIISMAFLLIDVLFINFIHLNRLKAVAQMS